MEENKLTHRAGLVREAAEILNRYTPPPSAGSPFRLRRTAGSPPGWNGPTASPWPKAPTPLTKSWPI